MITNGVDITHISRIKKSLINPRFITRILGSREEDEFLKRGSQTSYIAGNFAAKEAFSKALGTGMRGFHFRDVQVLRDDLGAPYFVFSGNAKIIIEEKGLSFALSISHDGDLVIAMVTAWPSRLFGREQKC